MPVKLNVAHPNSQARNDTGLTLDISAKNLKTHAFKATESVRTEPGTPLSQDSWFAFLSPKRSKMSVSVAVRCPAMWTPDYGLIAEYGTYRDNESNRGRNSFNRATLSKFRLDRLIEVSPSQ